MANRPRAIALSVIGLSLVFVSVWFWQSTTRRDGINFLPHRSGGKWILYPSTPDTASHSRTELDTEFRRSFKFQNQPPSATLLVAGFRRYSVRVNGTELMEPTQRGRNWKQPDTYEVARLIRPGENEIAVTVFNSNGPPAVWLLLQSEEVKFGTDETWETGGTVLPWRSAWLASQSRVTSQESPVKGSPTYGGESPWTALGAKWPALLIFAALAGLVIWGTGRRSPSPVLYVFLGITGLWVILFANNMRSLPPLTGFDVDAHIAYIKYIQDNNRLPLANEGPQMHQSPLYYLISAGLLELFLLSPADASGVTALRIFGLLVGIGLLFLVWASTRLLFPSEVAKQKWALMLAAFLPPMIYLSQYVTNEVFAAAWVSASVYFCLRIIGEPTPKRKLYAVLGICLGAAVLSKTTAILAILPVVGALAWKHLSEPRQSKWKWTVDVGLMLALAGGVCGWHLVRVWVHFGNPLIGSWDPKTGFAWWQDNGFQTARYYLSFGQSLIYPWFSGFHSFADGFYSTFWGDGMCGGAASIEVRPPWNYDFMAAGYLVVLPVCLTIVVGMVVAVAKFIRRPTAEWFLLLGMSFLMLVAMVQLTLQAPYFCHTKAFYSLVILVPLGAFAILGFEALGRTKSIRAALWVLAVVWAINTYATYWIRSQSASTYLARARNQMEEGKFPDAIQTLYRAAEREPTNGQVRYWLVTSLVLSGKFSEAKTQAELGLQKGTEPGLSHLAMAFALAQDDHAEPAIEHCQRAIELAPGNRLAHQQLAMLLIKANRRTEAAEICRKALAYYPADKELRTLLESISAR